MPKITIEADTDAVTMSVTVDGAAVPADYVILEQGADWDDNPTVSFRASSRRRENGVTVMQTVCAALTPGPEPDARALAVASLMGDRR